MKECKICFITCVKDEALYAESLLYLRQLILPQNVQVEFLPIRGAASMAAGYNEGQRKSDAKYKIYLHQDVLLLEKDYLRIILDIFGRNPAVGLIGLIGCEDLPESGIWWNGSNLYGRILHAPEPESISPSVCGEMQAEFCEVAAVDGLLMATQYDIPWREDLFDGWHFYDVSQCLEFRRRGYKTVIPQQNNDFCLHLSKQKPLGLMYWKYQQLFLKEYGGELARIHSSAEVKP